MSLRTRIAASLKDVRGHGQRLVQLNLELLKAELRDKGERYGLAVALALVAALLGLYAFGFALATIAVALHLLLPLWLSLLIVTVVLYLLILVLVLVARERFLGAGSPAPQKATAEARDSIAAAKAQLKRSRRGTGRTSVVAEDVPPRQSAPHDPAGHAGRGPREGIRDLVPGTASTDSSGATHEEAR